MTDQLTQEPTDSQTAGALRGQLRDAGWRSDLGWAVVGSGSAATVSGEARRTVVYLASLRNVDGGAAMVWKPGDVPAPAVADAREVFVTRPGDTEWHSQSLEPTTASVSAG